MRAWLQTDEQEEAVSSLEACARFSADLVSTDYEYHWKWVVVALHSAVQGFMVLALRGGNGLAALRPQNEARWLEARRRGQPPPKETLDGFLALYEKVKSDRMRFYVHSQSFSPSDTHDTSLKRLNCIRNDFIHFLPRSWALDVSGLPRIALDSLQLIDFLGWRSGNVVWTQEALRNRAESAKEMCRLSFSTLGEPLHGLAELGKECRERGRENTR